MRLHLRLSANRQPVPFSYPHYLTGAFHRWLGDNALHDGLSLYSLGWLQSRSSRVRGDALAFPQGATWFISAPDDAAGHALLERVAGAALSDPSVCCGMEVEEIVSEPTPDFGPKRVFRADSPVLVYGEANDANKDPHLRYDDPSADEVLTRVLQTKLRRAGLEKEAETATMRFDRDYKGAKTKLVHVKDDFYKRANFCPVIVEGSPEAVRFAFNVGAGHLSGSGFGSLV